MANSTEEKIQELEKELEKLKEEKLDDNTDSAVDEEIEEVHDQVRDEADQSGMSRRNFMKAIAGGGAALGAAAMMPNAAALDIESNNPLSYNDNFSVDTQGNLNLQGNNITNAGSIGAAAINADSADVTNQVGAGSVSTERTHIGDHLYARGNVGTDRDESSAASLNGVAIDNFEDLSEWSATESDIDLSAETDNPYNGTQSLKIESTADDTSVKLIYQFDSPIDLSEARSFSLAIWNPQGVTGISVDYNFRSPENDDFVIRQSLDDSTYPSGDWFRRDFGEVLAAEHDLTAVDEMRIQFPGKLDSGEAIYIDDPRVIHDYADTAGVIFGVDNPAGDENNNNAFNLDGNPFIQIFEEYGIPTTLWVDKDEVGQASNTDVEFLRNAQGRGHEVGSKILNSVDDMATDEIDSNLRQNKEWLLANDFYSAADYYAYTQNDVNEAAIDAAQKYYKMARAEGRGGLHGWQLTGLHTLPAQNISNVPDTDGINWVDQAIENNMVAHFYIHVRQVEGNESGFRDLLDHCRTKALEGKLEIVTTSELFERQNQRGSKNETETTLVDGQTQQNERIIATADSNDLDGSDYLDWQIDVPSGVREVEVRMFGLTDSASATYSATINDTTGGYWDVPIPEGTVSSDNDDWVIGDVGSGARQSNLVVRFYDYGDDDGASGFTSHATGWRDAGVNRDKAMRYGGVDTVRKMEGNTIEITGNDTENPSNFYAIAIGREFTGGGIL